MNELINANGYFKKFDVKIIFWNRQSELQIESMSLTTQKRTKYRTRAV